MECPDCSKTMDHATVSSGGYIGHYCWDCDLFVPNAGVTVHKPTKGVIS